MLTDRAKAMIEELCSSADAGALVEIVKIVKKHYNDKLRRSLDGWRPGQVVEVRMSPTETVRGTIVNVNKRTMTVDLGRRKVRISPSAAHLVRE